MSLMTPTSKREEFSNPFKFRSIGWNTSQGGFTWNPDEEKSLFRPELPFQFLVIETLGKIQQADRNAPEEKQVNSQYFGSTSEVVKFYDQEGNVAFEGAYSDDETKRMCKLYDLKYHRHIFCLAYPGTEEEQPFKIVLRGTAYGQWLDFTGVKGFSLSEKPFVQIMSDFIKTQNPRKKEESFHLPDFRSWEMEASEEYIQKLIESDFWVEASTFFKNIVPARRKAAEEAVKTEATASKMEAEAGQEPDIE